MVTVYGAEFDLKTGEIALGGIQKKKVKVEQMIPYRRKQVHNIASSVSPIKE